MKPKTYKISPLAEKDIEDILDYGLGELSLHPEKVFGYHEGLKNTFALLVKYPSMGSEYQHNSKYRKISYQRNRVVFYEIREDYIYIVRILHGKVDLPRRLEF